MLKEFKKFVLRGNVVDLAVAVAIGAAFGVMLTALVKDVVTPLIAAIFKRPDFSGISLTINHSVLNVGDFLNAVISFLIVATALFFFVVEPINKFQTIANKRKNIEPTEKECPECLSKIPVDAHRCMYCTSIQPK